jgi:pimeloyl-ACP methyl ester carboxylesterase
VQDTVVAAGEINLAVREFGGRGRHLLLLHGAGSSLADMAPLAACLAVDHRVVGMDLRNHGRSADGPWTWGAVLDDVHAVIEQCGLVDPLLVGHSLGGMLAAMYAHRRGGTAGAVNLDGYGIGTPEQYDMDPSEVRRLQAQLRAAGAQTIEAATRPLDGEQVRAAREAWLAGAASLGLDQRLAEEAFDRPLVIDPDGTCTRRPTAARLAELQTRIDELDVLGLYQEVTGPHLVYAAVRDAPDPALPPELQALASARRRGVIAELRRIARARPNLRVVELDAGHGLIYEQPQLIADQIGDFLAALTEQPVASAGALHADRAPA